MIELALIISVAGSAEGIHREAFAAAHDAIRFRPSMRLARPEAIPAPIEERIGACGLDLECVREQLVAIPVDVGLVAGINLLSEPPTVLVSLIDVKQRSVKERTGSGSAPAVLARLIAELLDEAGHPLAAQLIVRATPPGAIIRVDRQVALSGVPLSVVPGVHQIEAEHPGFVTATQQIDVAAGTRAELEIALQDEATIFDQPWFWVGVGSAVVITAATIAAIAAASAPDCLCVGGDRPECSFCP